MLSLHKEPMRRNAPLELVHIDVCQVDTKSHAGSQYFVTFIDDHSRKLWATPLKTKDQVLLLGTRSSMRKIKKHSIAVEYLRMTVFRSLHRERERERHKRLFIPQSNNTTPNLTKRLQGHYI